jgi:DNA-directed RNA polymerase beta subunit
MKTLKQTVYIQLQKGVHKIELNFVIPKLVEDNYVMINGRRKIPIFQLFDLPTVVRGENIKLRTNVATILINSINVKDTPHIQITLFGKTFSFCQLLCAYFPLDKIEERFNLKSQTFNGESTDLTELLMFDLKNYIEMSPGYTQDDFIVEIGRIYSKYAAKSKGEDILYAIDLIPKVDILTARFLRTGSIINELLYAIMNVNGADLDDTLFTNKRVRCFEYMIYSKISKAIFDLCFLNRTSRQPKFNVNSNQIISDCNVSEIVQFDFSINPIEELTKLSRISLLGPGGFKRENIPHYLRDINPSMFGRVCPVDTPDRDNCGVLQSLIPNVKLDENLKFTNEFLEKQPVSIAVSMVPFLEHDDQTRLQMASAQMRQAIHLVEFDEPLIQSGCEDAYTEYTQFIKKAKRNGEVIYKDEKFMTVVYDDNSIDLFNIEDRKIYTEHLDMMTFYFKVGERFKAGDILAESSFCKNGKITIGRNLLTGVMVYYGHNYEDGIIISDRLVKEEVFSSYHVEDLSFTVPSHKVLLPLHECFNENDYKPLPNVYETIERGTPYAILKEFRYEDFYSVFNDATVLSSNKKMIIANLKIYANNWKTEVNQYNNYIEKMIEKQNAADSVLKEILKERLPREAADKLIKENGIDMSLNAGKYKIKKEKINGVFVEMLGVYIRPVQIGDKLANRHGNKGVISQIIDHNKMPLLEDGRHLDICINPLGIISRMNIGQSFELCLGKILEDLKKKLLHTLCVDGEKTVKEQLLYFISIIDKTENNWYLKQFTEQLPEDIDEKFIRDLTLLQPPFESCRLTDLQKAAAFTETKFKQSIYEPVAKTKIINEIAVGAMYFFRLSHIAEEKLAARGIGNYAKRTLQPMGGRKNKGGQRCGEMETACLIAHDASKNLFEFLTTKSDCIDLKNRYIRQIINPGRVESEETIDNTPESVKLLNYYLKVIGVDQ